MKKTKINYHQKFSGGKPFGQSIDYKEGAIPEGCNSVILAYNRGGGLKPYQVLLPHQIYKKDITEKMRELEKEGGTVDISFIPVHSDEWRSIASFDKKPWNANENGTSRAGAFAKAVHADTTKNLYYLDEMIKDMKDRGVRLHGEKYTEFLRDWYAELMKKVGHTVEERRTHLIETFGQEWYDGDNFLTIEEREAFLKGNL